MPQPQFPEVSSASMRSAGLLAHDDHGSGGLAPEAPRAAFPPPRGRSDRALPHLRRLSSFTVAGTAPDSPPSRRVTGFPFHRPRIPSESKTGRTYEKNVGANYAARRKKPSAPSPLERLSENTPPRIAVEELEAGSCSGNTLDGVREGKGFRISSRVIGGSTEQGITGRRDGLYSARMLCSRSPGERTRRPLF